MGRGYSSQRCMAISIVEVTILAFKDVWEPKANASVSINEENWKLKYGFLDVAANVDFVSWCPSPLGYNGAFSCSGAEVQRQLSWGPCWGLLHMIYIPYTPRVCYVRTKILHSEQKCEERKGVSGCKHVGDEPIHENVIGLHITSDQI